MRHLRVYYRASYVFEVIFIDNVVIMKLNS